MVKYKIKKAVSLLGLTLLVASSMTPVQSGPREDNAKVMFPKVRADLAASGPLSDAEAVCVVGLAYAGNGARRHDPKVWDECLVGRFSGPVQSPVQQQKLLTAPEPQKLLEGGEPQKLLTAPDPKGLLTAPEPRKLLEGGEPQKLLTAPDPKGLLTAPEPQKLLEGGEPQKLLTGPEPKVVTEATNEVVAPPAGPVLYEKRVRNFKMQTRDAETGPGAASNPIQQGMDNVRDKLGMGAPEDKQPVQVPGFGNPAPEKMDQVKDAQGAVNFIEKELQDVIAGNDPDKAFKMEALENAKVRARRAWQMQNNDLGVAIAREVDEVLKGVPDDWDAPLQ